MAQWQADGSVYITVTERVKSLSEMPLILSYSELMRT